MLGTRGPAELWRAREGRGVPTQRSQRSASHVLRGSLLDVTFRPHPRETHSEMSCGHSPQKCVTRFQCCVGTEREKAHRDIGFVWMSTPNSNYFTHTHTHTPTHPHTHTPTHPHTHTPTHPHTHTPTHPHTHTPTHPHTHTPTHPHTHTPTHPHTHTPTHPHTHTPTHPHTHTPTHPHTHTPTHPHTHTHLRLDFCRTVSSKALASLWMCNGNLYSF